MDHGKLKEEQLKLEKKLSKEPALASRIQKLRALADKSDRTSLEFEIKELSKHAQAIESQQKSDLFVEKAKEELKDSNASYREQRKYNKLQARLVGLLLQELDNFEGENK